ncbi:hypothetical protein [Maricaulis sp.]|uniref:hypothetical protein n=1 Tax=Maricaulis sp. TaxID=1486257 RepID=UPI003A8DD5D3
MKTSQIAALAATVFIVSACTSTPKVNVRQPGDRNLSCAEIQSEFDSLDNVQNEAEDNQGVNTANVAAVLFFWPAAVGNYMDADRAMDLVEERRAVLMDLYEAKSCDA